jgi:beta-lactam-binding protein with PASTA domain
LAGESLSGQSGWALTGLAPGALVAGYRVESRIGAGGMAMVLRARDEALGRTVALKILAPGHAGDAEFRERFVRESRAVAAVDHPHIIPVYAAGEADGVLYLAMRFVPGGDLHSVIKREGPLAGDRAVDLLTPIASALDAAHAAGLVHRDVKPANILVDAGPGRPEHPYLSDFGLAKGAAASAGLTGTGQFLGTPDYAAPEQISGQPARPQTDQYALACVAFTALTGSLPFAREESMAVLWAHVYDPPPSVTSYRRDLPGAVDGVLARALAKAPGERYASCAEFAGALRAALDAAPPTATAGQLAASGFTAPGPAPGPVFSPAPVPGDERPRPLTVAGSTLGSPLAVALRDQLTADRPAEGTRLPAPATYPSGRPAGPLAGQGGGDEPLARWRPGRRAAYAVAALVVLAGLGGGGWWLAAGRYSAVPAVGKLTAASAGQVLRQAGFQVRTGEPAVDDSVPKGEVVSVSPSGRAPRGATITLTLSQGPRMIDVPPIPQGDTLAQARAALRAAGLTVASATEPVGVPSAPRIGAVAGSDPAAGTSVPENRPVVIEVVAGLALPNLLGQNIAVIQAWAAQNHLSLQLTQVSNGQPQGTVLAQSPAQDTPVRPGQTVSLSVSSGPPMVSVPDVQGQTCPTAQSELQQAGFSVAVQQGLFHAGNATSVTPSGQAPSGSTVTLECGSSAAF